MGGDGGSIPKRADVVKTSGYRFIRNLGGLGYLPNSQVRAGTDKYNASENRRLRLTHCFLSHQPLKPPLVACRLGLLYNKEAFLERFLQRKTLSFPDSLNHIKTRKDVKDLTVEFDQTSRKLVCPIAKVEFEAGVKGVILWSCGCVVSCKAFSQLTHIKKHIGETYPRQGLKRSFPNNEKEITPCPVCSRPFSYLDIIPLVPDEETLAELKRNLLKSENTPKVKCRRETYEQHPPKSPCLPLQDREASFDASTVKITSA